MVWTPTEPAAGSDGESADLRQNWAALATGMGQPNLVGDNSHQIWAGGDAVEPTMWELTGAGAAVARAGTGLADTHRFFGDFCPKVTAGGGAVAGLRQYVIPVGAFAPFDWLKGKAVSFGLGLWCATAGSVRGFISDGVTNAFTGFHSGLSVWQWLTGTLPAVDNAATQIVINIELAAGVVAYPSGHTVIFGEVPPSYPSPSLVQRKTERFEINGTLAVLSDARRFSPRRPGIIRQMQLSVKTAPTGADVITDLGVWNGAALVSAFTTLPRIVATNSFGGQDLDGTYSRRCLNPMFGTTRKAGDQVSLFVTQIGSGVAGADLSVALEIDEYTRPLDVFLPPQAYR